MLATESSNILSPLKAFSGGMCSKLSFPTIPQNQHCPVLLFFLPMKSHLHHLNQFILMRGFENVLLGGLCSQVHPSLG
jgi:hypothetical protein